MIMIIIVITIIIVIVTHYSFIACTLSTKSPKDKQK